MASGATATKITGLSRLDKTRYLGTITALSCGSACNCSAGGSVGPDTDAFVVSQTNGRWRAAQAVTLPADISP